MNSRRNMRLSLNTITLGKLNGGLRKLRRKNIGDTIILAYASNMGHCYDPSQVTGNECPSNEGGGCSGGPCPY